MNIKSQEKVVTGTCTRGVAAHPGSKKSKSTANTLLEFAGTWKGDDLEKCLHEVYKTRG